MNKSILFRLCVVQPELASLPNEAMYSSSEGGDLDYSQQVHIKCEPEIWLPSPEPEDSDHEHGETQDYHLGSVNDQDPLSTQRYQPLFYKGANEPTPSFAAYHAILPLATESTKFECKLCEKSSYFATSNALTSHIKSCHTKRKRRAKELNVFPSFKKNKDGIFSCDQCNSNFRHRLTYRSHLIKHHGLPTPYMCSQCGKMFPAKSSLETHEVTHTNERQFKCNLCPQNYRRAADLRYHKTMQHDSGNGEQFGCIVCKKVYKCKTSLRNHLTSRHKPTTVDPKCHICNICGAGFKIRTFLNRHMNTHTRELEYHCSLCNKVYAHKSGLEYHMKSHLNIKPFKCDRCGKSFVGNQLLVSHQRTHSGEKPYCCRICHQRFSQHSIMYRHMRSHGNAPIYACDVCGEGARTKAELAMHLKLIHNQQ